MTLRVAQIVTTLAKGGAQATVMASVDLAHRGVAVTVLAGPDVTKEGSYWDEKGLKPAVLLVPHLVRRISPVNDLRALIWLIAWLRDNRPDVVHTHSSKAGVIGRLAAAALGIPTAHTIHGWGPLYSATRWIRVAAAATERMLANLTGALVVVGTRDLHRGLRCRIGNARKYRVIRSGVDTSGAGTAAEERDAIRAELLLTGRFVVGMVARMSFPKDHKNLVLAFERAAIPNATLLLIGDGPQRAEVERLVAASGLASQVLILGLRPDAARIVAAFDVAMLSSRWEGLPRSVVEAAAAGVPVVATDVGSVGDLIEDGVSGRLVPTRDVDAMAEALRLVYAEPQAHRTMAAVARSRSADYSVERMQLELVELWSELAGRGTHRLEQTVDEERSSPPALEPETQTSATAEVAASGQPLGRVGRRRRSTNVT